MQKKRNEQEPTRLVDALTAVAPRTSLTTRQPEMPCDPRLDARFDGCLKICEWVEGMVQIRLDPEQRAHIVRELAETELPSVTLNCAARIIAGGFIETYGRLDMAVWRKAIDEVPHQIGKLNKFYRQGSIDAQNMLWRNIKTGIYNDTLKQILEDTQS